MLKSYYVDIIDVITLAIWRYRKWNKLKAESFWQRRDPYVIFFL